MKVGVIDYGVGNLGSVLRALEELRVSPLLLTTPASLRSADTLILPGVGNFTDCARLLHEGGWVSALRDEVLTNTKPLLGVCVGMQLLASRSMEGAEGTGSDGTPGLDLVPGRVQHLRTLQCSLRVPHVGWNSVTRAAPEAGLFAGIPDGTDFYFVHSYAFVADDPADVLAQTHYDVPLTAAVRRGHIWGTQFHPEKSSRAGFRLLRNFIENPAC
jgi:imidazole glycerol-phosphate synthase subunit HisH